MQNLLALPAGTELVEDYRILRVLGAGGFGLTYLAQEETLERSVTIKEYFPSDYAAREATLSVRPRSVDTEEDYGWGLERFIEEAQTLARFDHPNINRVYRYFRANNTGYIVLQFEEGQSFKSWLQGLGRAPRQAELDVIVAPLLDALQTIHAGNYLHRDIAPDNIIIRKSGEPVLIDFGSARGEMVQLSKTVSALVKPGYSPYEQYGISGRQQGPWTDIYSLGATLYQAISGKRPTDAPTRMLGDDYRPAAQVALSSYRPQFLAAIDHALKLKIEQRPQSISVWRKALAAGMNASVAASKAPQPKPAKARSESKALQQPVASMCREEPASEALTPRRTGLKQRLVRALEGIAAPREAAKAALPAGSRARPEAARPEGAALLARAATPSPAKTIAPAVPAKAPSSASSPRRWSLLGRMRSRAPVPGATNTVAIAARAVPKPAASKPVAPTGSTSRAYALKLLSGAALSAVLLSYQDEIRHAWSVLGWTGDRATDTAPPQTSPRTLASRTAESRPANPGITTSSTMPSARDAVAPPTPDDLVIKAHRGPANAIAFTGDGRSLISTGQDGTLRLWDVARRDIVRTVEAGESPAALAVQDRIAAVALQDGRTVIWDLDRGSQIRSLKRSDAGIRSVVFAGDAEKVLTGSQDAIVAVWEHARDPNPVQLLEGHQGAVQALAFTPLGASTGLLATGGADKLVKIWGLADGTLLRTYRGHRDAVSALAFSRDGTMVASAGADKTVRVWPTGDGGSSRRLHGHKARVTALSFSADGQVLASASEDGSVRLWDWKRGRAIRTLSGHVGPIRSVAFSPDGRTLVSAGDDGTLHLWDVTALGKTVASRS